MTRRLALSLLLLSGLSVGIGGGPAQAVTRHSHARSACPVPAATTLDPRVSSLLRRLLAATMRTKTMTADFTYTVTSVKSQQFVTGSFRVMKPNFARVQFSYMAQPAFPNLVASDGKTINTFTPNSFLANRTFAPGYFASRPGARQASGLEAGGGKYSTQPAQELGANVHLWDAIPFQAFFDAETALYKYGYVGNMNELKYEGAQKINGVTYRVLSHHVENGNIAGGETTPFEQYLYIGSDDLIHQYVLKFKSGGKPGVQVMLLQNIKVNVPLGASDFAFTPPVSHTGVTPLAAAKQP